MSEHVLLERLEIVGKAGLFPHPTYVNDFNGKGFSMGNAVHLFGSFRRTGWNVHFRSMDGEIVGKLDLTLSKDGTKGTLGFGINQTTVDWPTIELHPKLVNSFELVVQLNTMGWEVAILIDGILLTNK